jgi:GNAT superfamily N-acetyltransferase
MPRRARRGIVVNSFITPPYTPVEMTTRTSPNATAIREIAPGESLKPFIDLSWTMNRGDPHWVPPLRMSVRNALDRGKHPFHAHAEVAYFLAERGGRPVGRIAAIANRLHNEFHSDRVGFFGLFECEDDPGTAAALLDAAGAWLRARGFSSMRGPMNFSTNEEVASPGVLIDGFDTPPVFMMTHNPRYYDGLLAGNGMSPSKDLVAFWMDSPEQIQYRGREMVDRILKREQATVRPLDLKRFDEDLARIKEVYNSAWSLNWGFVPMTDAEFDHLAREFRPVVDPDLCLIAEVRGEPVGFSLALPNLNEAIRHLPDGRLFPFGWARFLWHRRKIDSMRVLTLGFKPRYQRSGLGVAFYMRTFDTGIERGYTRGEASWILEDNHEMVRALERMGARIYRRYRIYDRDL